MKMSCKPQNHLQVQVTKVTYQLQFPKWQLEMCLKEHFLFIEACCGSALLSSCVARSGFDVLAIDFHGNKHRPFVHVVELDLRKRSTWSFLEHLARSRRPFHFHAAIMRHSFESERCRSCGRSTWAPTTAFRRLPHGISVANWFLERQSRICKFDLYPPCGLLFLVEFSSDWVEH